MQSNKETVDSHFAKDSVLHLYARGGGVSEELLSDKALLQSKNADGDTPLHVAAKHGDLEIVQRLLTAGADPLVRNHKNRTPRSQIKIGSEIKECLMEAEEAWKEQRRDRDGRLWDAKMRATQTESAFGVGVL